MGKKGMEKKVFDMDELRKKRLLNKEEAAAYIGVCDSTMHTTMHAKDFPALVRIGHRVFVNREVLDKWIDDKTGW